MLRVRIPAGRGTSPEQIYFKGVYMTIINNGVKPTPVPFSTTIGGARPILNGWRVSSGVASNVYFFGYCWGSSATPDTGAAHWRIMFISVDSYNNNQAGIIWSESTSSKYYENKIITESSGTSKWYYSNDTSASFNGRNFYTGYQFPVIYIQNPESRINNAIDYMVEWIESGRIPVDPYTEGGTSEPGGGGGSFDDSTDVITEPSYDPVELLNRSYGNRGFVHVYLPTQAELTSLHAFMWDNALITEMQKMFNNVVDSVISLNLIPLDFTDETPNRGNILMGLVDSQIETTIAKQQFVTLDCGTIEIDEFFASYLDYSPYSKLQIYLPYIGVKDLDIDEFMNAYINVKYVVDIVSGACVAFISKSGAIDNAVVKDNPILGVLYQFAGNCALNVPISGVNYAQVHAADIGAIISGAGIVGAFATGGMSAPAAVTGVLSTAANVVTSKPSVTRGGSIPSTAGYMGVQKPYLILTRPRMCLPEDQSSFTGYPAYISLTPGDTLGYTEFEEIHLENIPATDAEKDEIMNLMKTGVIL